MSDTPNDPDLEGRVRRGMHSQTRICRHPAGSRRRNRPTTGRAAHGCLQLRACSCSAGSSICPTPSQTTYVDDDEGGIVIPIDGGRRIVAPDDYFRFGGGGPFIEPDALVEIATAIGRRPLDQVDQLPGFFVFHGSTDGQAIAPFGLADVTRVEHGQSGSPSLTPYRLAEPPTALELLVISNVLYGGELDDPAIGDTALTSQGQSYLELVSPVDLVMLDAPGYLDAMVQSIDFVPLADLAEAIDGSVSAPPRPEPTNTDADADEADE